MGDRLRVLLADDHAFFRAGVRQELGAYPHIEVVGEVSDGRQAIHLARETEPDVILMDINMPRCDGLEALDVIKRELPRIQVIMLSVHQDDDNLIKALRRGANGYLLKNSEPAELLDMLDRVSRGEPAITGRLVGSAAMEPLTPREIAVLQGVARGESNVEIAQALVVTENTVRMHVRNLLEKLRLENRVQAAVYAVQQGLVPDE